MSQEFDIIPANQLSEASDAEISNGQLLIATGGRVKRATATKMKGEKGDKMKFSDLSSKEIEILQKPAIDAAEIASKATEENILATKSSIEATKENVKATQDSINATGESEDATKKAIQKTKDMSDLEGLISKNEDTRVLSENLRQEQEESRQKNTTVALQNVESATSRLNEISDHPPINQGGYWAYWNEETKQYVKSSDRADGNLLYATFWVNPFTGKLIMYTDEDYDGPTFELVNGNLIVKI